MRNKYVKRIFFCLIGVVLCFVGMVSIENVWLFMLAVGIGAVLAVYTVLVLPILSIREHIRIKNDPEIQETIRREKLKKVEMEQARKDAQRKEKLEQEYKRAESRAAAFRDNHPVAARLISTQDSMKTKGGALSATTRGVVGGMVAGPVGAVIGAATGVKKTEVTGQKAVFAVEYESGRRGTEIVTIGSSRFQILMDLTWDS